MDKEIVIKPSFEFKIVFSAMKSMWISKISNKIALFIYLFFMSCLFISLLLIKHSDLMNLLKEFKDDYINLLVVFIIPLFHYLLFYIKSKNLLKNYRLSENIEFIFNKDFFEEKGDTFDIKHFWDKLYKIKECKNYFLIYQNKNRANIIPKTNITDNQYNELKELFSSLNIKKSLK